MGYDYTYLANTFSEIKGITIQQFIIIHKIERVKELLFYDALNLAEVSYILHYSNAAHWSNQLKNNNRSNTIVLQTTQIKRKLNLEDIKKATLRMQDGLFNI
ncbi:hypothetical protein N7U66_01625 [Lacinutrix neustonica]|uniref:HTH araC/xylS-type domain-containing protein n=1 Tax=Lacinutrix neustonica TaxID=2980107 RepID=A0A9E8MW43_9FLAO|nr:hypothetical protein [Lacinutrix neustonica]WAC02441.1 hypothetical protein N7U66_01625 [Lacinutrix neustonica]